MIFAPSFTILYFFLPPVISLWHFSREESLKVYLVKGRVAGSARGREIHFFHLLVHVPDVQGIRPGHRRIGGNDEERTRVMTLLKETRAKWAFWALFGPQKARGGVLV